MTRSKRTHSSWVVRPPALRTLPPVISRCRSIGSCPREGDGRGCWGLSGATVPRRLMNIASCRQAGRRHVDPDTRPILREVAGTIRQRRDEAFFRTHRLIVDHYEHSRQRRRGQDPPIFDLRQCVGLTKTSTQSRVQRIIFVNVIDCVVGAVVEQVYSCAVTCSRENTIHHYHEML